MGYLRCHVNKRTAASCVHAAAAVDGLDGDGALMYAYGT